MWVTSLQCIGVPLIHIIDRAIKANEPDQNINPYALRIPVVSVWISVPSRTKVVSWIIQYLFPVFKWVSSKSARVKAQWQHPGKHTTFVC